MKEVKSLSGLAGPNASLKDAGGGGAGYSGVMFMDSSVIHSWTVPAGVNEIYAVCVGGGGAQITASVYASGGQSYISRGATVLCSANGGTASSGTGSKAGGSGGVKHGGGNGGAGYFGSPNAGGGAGGYSGNGGTVSGASASGGGGASGGFYPGAGGVGILGEGPSGTPDNSSNGGSGGEAGLYSSSISKGGYFGGGGKGGGGGELSWVNAVPVTPGETLTIVVGSGGRVYNGGASVVAGSGVVAIYWGNCGEFPLLEGVPKPW